MFFLFEGSRFKSIRYVDENSIFKPSTRHSSTSAALCGDTLLFCAEGQGLCIWNVRTNEEIRKISVPDIYDLKAANETHVVYAPSARYAFFTLMDIASEEETKIPLRCSNSQVVMSRTHLFTVNTLFGAKVSSMLEVRSLNPVCLLHCQHFDFAFAQISLSIDESRLLGKSFAFTLGQSSGIESLVVIDSYLQEVKSI